jgi:acetyl-CoA carboxylase carboxyl transferase subunit alpha
MQIETTNKMTQLLDFEKPIFELEEKLREIKRSHAATDANIEEAVKIFEDKIKKLKEDTFNNLTRWQRVQVSRHPNRPYTLDYIQNIFTDFVELHGDRQFGDDKAMVGGFAKLDGTSFMVIGQQKGRNTKERQYRNFGMPNPEGYRKALRLMQLADKFGKPIICFIDTPGAFPGIEAEERGQGEAIARNLKEMFKISVPIICIIIGEGASGGALGIGIGDRVLMLRNTWYSVISPESCSSILWRSWEYKEQAAEALKLTAEDMFGLGLVDGIIEEPLGGAHNHPQETYRLVKDAIQREHSSLARLDKEILMQKRTDKFCNMGAFEEKFEAILK